MKNIKLWHLLIAGIAIIFFMIWYKKYLIDQAFAKGILEDTPINRQAFANQNLMQVIQTLKNLKS